MEIPTNSKIVPTKWCNEKVNTTDSLAHPSHGKTFKHMTGHAN